MIKKKVIIIGAGPAGIAASIILAKQGVKCCILEKEKHPREKACGGLLTAKTFDLLSTFASEFKFDYFALKKIIVENDLQKVCEYNTEIPFYVVNRKEFDAELLKISKAEIIEECHVKEIDSANNILKTSKGVFEYENLIIANGSSSIKIDNHIPKRKYKYIAVSAKKLNTNQESDSIKIIFNRKFKGYGWIFPMSQNVFNVGFCKKVKSFGKIKEDINRFNMFYGFEGMRYSGKFINNTNTRSYLEKIGSKANILVIGEAANYIDSLTGEGIYYALLTGIAAGKYLSKNISFKDYNFIERKLTFLINSSSFTAALIWSRLNIIQLLLKVSAYTIKLNKHMTNNLINNMHYNYYNAYLSPLVCYSNIKLRYNFEDKILKRMNIDG